MKRSSLLAMALCLSAVPPAFAGVKVLPADVTLTGPQASQRLLVFAEADGNLVGDVTGEAKFASSNAAVATVDAAGIVHATGDGEAVITATHKNGEVTAKVRVERAKEAFVPSFRNHVIP